MRTSRLTVVAALAVAALGLAGSPALAATSTTTTSTATTSTTSTSASGASIEAVTSGLAARPVSASVAVTTVSTTAIKAPSWCKPGLGVYNRTRFCGGAVETLHFTINGVRVGTLKVQVIIAQTASAKSLTVHDNVQLKVTSATGRAKGAKITFSASCGAKCKVTDKVGTLTAAKGRTLTGKMSQKHTLKAKASSSRKVAYVLHISKKDYPKGKITLKSLAIRCDRRGTVKGYTQGCVIPGYKPTLHLSGTDTVSALVQQVQTDGAHHYGDQDAGSYSLHRTTTAATITANADTACGGRTAPSQDVVCDSYPFTTTAEGASRTTQPDWNWGWVPVAEKTSRDSRLTAFYAAQRVLNKDGFWVVP